MALISKKVIVHCKTYESVFQKKVVVLNQVANMIETIKGATMKTSKNFIGPVIHQRRNGIHCQNTRVSMWYILPKSNFGIESENEY